MARKGKIKTSKAINLAEGDEKIKGKRAMYAQHGRGGEQLIRSYDMEEQRVDELKIQDYRRMQDNDGIVQMLLNAIYTTILSAGITIEDDPNLDQQDESEQLKFVRDNLLNPKTNGGMTVSMTQVNRIALRAFIEGYRLFEVIWRLDPDNKIRLDRLSPVGGVNDREVKLIVDSKGDFLGVHQRISFASEIIDIEILNTSEAKKIIRAVWGGEFGSLYGRSGLKSVWYHYDKAHKAMFLSHIGLELGVIKPRMIAIKGNPRDEVTNNLLNALSRMHVESTVSYPADNYEVTFAESTDAAVMREGIEIIKLHYSTMAKALLAQFLDLGSNTASTGSRALGESQLSFFTNGLQALATTLIEDPWNEVISDLVKVNFGVEIMPTLKVNPISHKKAEALYELMLEVVKSGSIPDILKKKVLKRGAGELGLEVSEEELTESPPVAPVTPVPPVLTSEHQHREIGLQELEGSPVPVEEPVRMLYPDEQKVRLLDIKRKLANTKAQAEVVLETGLARKRDEVINKYVQAMRDGSASIRRVKIELQDLEEFDYRQDMKNVSQDLFEFGKVMAANEIGGSVPSTPRRIQRATDDEVDSVVDEQETRLQLRLQTVANRALAAGIPENDAVLLLEQEYDAFWDVVVLGALGVLIGRMFNQGRQWTFDKYQAEIFAYRYTAVLDNRTTEYCRALDGRVFQSTDPQYFMLTPPQHFNCRSFWTPILKTESNGVIVNGKPEGLPVFSSVSTFRDTV